MAEKSGFSEVGADDLAALLGITPRWLQKLEKKGIISKAKRGRYPLPQSVQAYIKFKIESALSRMQPEETNPGERVKAERARKLKLENDEKEHRLVTTSDAISALDHIVGQLKADLAGVPARVSDDVPTRRRVEDALDTVLGGLADRFRKTSRDLQTGGDPLSSDGEDDT